MCLLLTMWTAALVCFQRITGWLLSSQLNMNVWQPKADGVSWGGRVLTSIRSNVQHLHRSLRTFTSGSSWQPRGGGESARKMQRRHSCRARSQKLACWVPPDECFEGYDPEPLFLLLMEAYGLVSGPSWWRRSLLEVLVKELGYRVNVYDRCVHTLERPQRVGDMLEAGNEVHLQKM